MTATFEDNQVKQMDVIPDSKSIMDAINSQASLDRVRALVKLLSPEELDIEIVGEKHKISNLELMTEYSNAKTTQFMVRNETWRKSVQEVLHLKDINKADKLVGFMDYQVQLKMVSHRRKGRQEFVNGLRNEQSGTEIIPSNTKKKRFFEMM